MSNDGTKHIRAPNYTQAPNVFFDYWLSRLTPSEAVLFATFIRQTFGWKMQRETLRAEVSINRLMDVSGLEKRSLLKSLSSLEEQHGLIVKTNRKNKKEEFMRNSYELVLHADEDEDEEEEDPLFYVSHFTQIPNVLFDYWIPKLKQQESIVLLAMCRKTFGFHKGEDYISYDQICQMTGMSRRNAMRIVPGLEAHGLIEKHVSISPDGDNNPNLYRVVVKKESPRKKANLSGGSVNLTPPQPRKNTKRAKREKRETPSEQCESLTNLSGGRCIFVTTPPLSQEEEQEERANLSPPPSKSEQICQGVGAFLSPPVGAFLSPPPPLPPLYSLTKERETKETNEPRAREASVERSSDRSFAFSDQEKEEMKIPNFLKALPLSEEQKLELVGLPVEEKKLKAAIELCQKRGSAVRNPMAFILSALRNNWVSEPKQQGGATSNKEWIEERAMLLIDLLHPKKVQPYMGPSYVEFSCLEGVTPPHYTIAHSDSHFQKKVEDIVFRITGKRISSFNPSDRIEKQKEPVAREQISPEEQERRSANLSSLRGVLGSVVDAFRPGYHRQGAYSFA